MTCQRAAEQMSRVLDDPHAGRFWLGAHLALCRNCRRFRRQLAVLEAAAAVVGPSAAGTAGLSGGAKVRIADALKNPDDDPAAG